MLCVLLFLINIEAKSQEAASRFLLYGTLNTHIFICIAQFVSSLTLLRLRRGFPHRLPAYSDSTQKAGQLKLIINSKNARPFTIHQTILVYTCD